ncbi:MAG: rRNA pseudouridine synthase [Lachnospiraceae bacterium]|nr:rRNA pseudouridine synthase [Lachnospiraceae bacterium]
MRLDKYLGDTALLTRKEAAEAIRRGRVTVEGAAGPCKPNQNIDPASDVVLLDGEVLRYQTCHYLMLHKPAGFITATEGSTLTVMDLVPKVSKNLFPVGRLDKDTEGLLLITDDGSLGHRLLSPKHHVGKTYEVHTRAPLSGEDLDRLRSGVDIGEKELTLPAEAAMDGEGHLLLTLYEGRYHQVKRMLLAVGNEVVYLKRLSFGPLQLGDLTLGACRELTEEEAEALRNA